MEGEQRGLREDWVLERHVEGDVADPRSQLRVQASALDATQQPHNSCLQSAAAPSCDRRLGVLRALVLVTSPAAAAWPAFLPAPSPNSCCIAQSKQIHESKLLITINGETE